MIKKHLIDKIEINKFRSFSSSETIVVNNLNIFSGKNNVGKSNVLKLLNLFFNNETGFNESFDFDTDYNKGYSGNRGHNNEIIITIYFTGNHTSSSILKNGFAIRKRFIKDSTDVEISYFVLEGRSKNKLKEINKNENRKIASFNKFYNKIRYIYVPAIRDKQFIKHIFTYLEDILEQDSKRSYAKSFNELTKNLKENTLSIEQNFKKFINVNTSIEAPQKIKDILSGINIQLKQDYKVKIKTGRKDLKGSVKYKYENPNIAINSSGDGIMMGYIPHFLNYLTKKLKTNHFIWGFEEPENSLEYSKIQDIALKFLNEFSKLNQIFLTTHSPAFINLKDKDGVGFFRVYKKNSDKDSLTKIQTEKELKKDLNEYSIKGDLSIIRILNEEIHHIDLSNEIEAHVKNLLIEQGKIKKEQTKINAIQKELIKLKPKKIFIYEDKKALIFWKYCFKQIKLKDIEFRCSNGCTNFEQESALKIICLNSSTYKPKVYRLNDSDGFLKEDYKTLIETEMSQKYDFKYKFNLLPVCEIENFEILNNLDEFQEWFKNLDVDLIIDFSDKTKTTLMKNYGLFNKKIKNDLFEYSKKESHIKLLMDFNKTDKLKYFAGKEIFKKAKGNLEVIKIEKTTFSNFPNELKTLLDDIKSFFENTKVKNDSK